MEEKTLEEIFGSYTAWQFAQDSWCISFMEGTEYMYLLEGTEKALLLDTGYGTGTLRAFVEGLTHKPLVVANTHVHPDHAAGNGEFERVLMSRNFELDAPSVYSPQAVPFDLGKLPYPDYEKCFVKDGDTIELGGRTIEILEAKPAHCNTSLFFLDRGRGMLFCGDDMESTQVLMYDNSNNPDAPYDVEERLLAFRENCERMKELSPFYTYLLPNHNGTPIDKSYVDDYLQLVDHIFAGDALIEDKLNHKYIEMDPNASRLCRVRYGKASIFIVKELLMKVYGSKGDR